jgi:hypothetical protein
MVNNLFVEPSVNNLLISLNLLNIYANNENFSKGLSYTPSYSILNTPGRSSIQPNSNSQGYNYSVSVLSDILTKREYIYKEYFLNNGYIVRLPKYLLSSPSNPLLDEIKNSYQLVNPSTFTSEISRDFYYQNLNLFKLSLLNSMNSIIEKNLNISGLNISVLSNYILFYFFSYDSVYNNNYNLELYKNQYKPVKKGVNNMIRLHATGAIAMPIEIRLHILASSKDVIHS